MKTKTIELYEFDELPEKIKAKVLEKERYINTEGYDWFDFTFDDWTEKLEGMGFEDPNISFTGFYSQGDGASFTCKSIDIEKFLTSQKARRRFKNILKGLKEDKIEANIEIKRIDHHYSHEYTVRAESEVLYNNGYPKNYAAIEKEEGELRALVLDVARDLMKEIYRDLEQEYEGLTSDEAVIDTIKANEYTFRADGTMENE